MKTLLTFIACLFAVVGQSATIYCTNVLDISGGAPGLTSIKYNPYNTKPQPYQGGTVYPKPLTYSFTNNAFTNQVVAGGVYSVLFQPANSFVKSVDILVPSDDTNLYTFNQVMQFATNGYPFVWTNNPIYVTATNLTGYALVQVTNIAVSVGGGGNASAITNYDTRLVTLTNSLNQFGGQYVDLYDSSAPTWKEGRVLYDTNQHTLAVYNDVSDVMLNVGSEQLVRASNKSGANIANGSVVYVSGAQGQLPTVSLAIATNEVKSGIIGIATHNITNNTIGYVTVQGVVNELNTASFMDGDALYLSTTTLGGLTTNQPAAPNYMVSVGTVLYSHSQHGKILVNIVPQWVGWNSVIGKPDVVTNNQTSVTLTGSFTATGGNVVTNTQPNLYLGSSGSQATLYLWDEPNTAYAPISILDSTLSLTGIYVEALSFSGNGGSLTNLQSTNLVGVLPMGTLTTGTIVTNGFLTTDGTNRSYSKNAQYLTNVQDVALSTNVALLNQNSVWRSNGVAMVTIGTNGTVTTSTGSAASPGLVVGNEPSGLYKDNPNSIAISANGTYMARFYSNGGNDGVSFSRGLYTSQGYGLGSGGTVDVSVGRRSAGVAQIVTANNGSTLAPLVASSFTASGTITATNGYIFPPKSSGPTWTQIGASNTAVMWATSTIPQIIYARSFDAQSNAVDVSVIDFQPRWVDALASGATLQSGASAPTVRDLPGTWADSIAARGYSYDQGNWSSFSIQAPHVFATTNGYFQNFYYEPHVHISPNTSLATGTNATFVMQWQVSDVYGSFTGSPVLCVTNTASFTNAAQHMVISFGNITNNALAGKASVIFRGSIRRAAAAVSDVGNTATTSPFVDSVDFHVPVRKLGSTSQYSGE